MRTSHRHLQNSSRYAPDAKPAPNGQCRPASNGGNGRHGGDPYVLITGGAGFIGCNLADRLLRNKRRVRVFDNLSRRGVERNLEWLRHRHPELLEVQIADIRDATAVREATARAQQVFHFTAQVAVTTSLVDPITDFEVNARGTLNLLEALRVRREPPPVVFTSTNKVYGALDDVPLHSSTHRYQPSSQGITERGIDEERPLDFHSPYGCSKGTADQYVIDFARTMGVPGIVFRMSCIYGPRQRGTEDQGWVAHFLIRAVNGEPITLYGDGRQVRDILFIEDLVDAFLLAQANMSTLSGQAFNIGGGPANTTSLLELMDLIEELQGRRPELHFSAWRTADQRYYVSNIRKFSDATGWSPTHGVRDGVRKLYEWLKQFPKEPKPDLELQRAAIR